MREPLFLGIDGGGTRCRARICDVDGKTLGEGRAGPANVRLGLEQAFREIGAASNEALAGAGLAPDAIGRLHAGLGLAGLVLQTDRALVREYPNPFASMVAETDAHVACLGAHAGRDGAILVLGTGSCACGIVGGEPFTIGGWGFQIADQGSGATLGRAAIRKALWAHEGVVPATALTDAVMARFDRDPEQALQWGEQARPRDYAAFAPLVFVHAGNGDRLAVALVEEAAGNAALLIRALVARGVERVALLGGLARPLADHLPADVSALLTEADGDALDGAVRMARAHVLDAVP